MQIQYFDDLCSDNSKLTSCAVVNGEKIDRQKKSAEKITYPPPADALCVVNKCKPAVGCNTSCRPRRLRALAGGRLFHSAKGNEELCSFDCTVRWGAASSAVWLQATESVGARRKNPGLAGFSIPDLVISDHEKSTRCRPLIRLEPTGDGDPTLPQRCTDLHACSTATSWRWGRLASFCRRLNSLATTGVSRRSKAWRSCRA